jgi:hypothetical protein
MQKNVPDQPANSFRVTLVLEHRSDRLDGVLLEAIRQQKENVKLRNISRSALKTLFNEKKILIKGQPARPASALAPGTTYVDILFP